jgi:hypothetical protein
LRIKKQGQTRPQAHSLSSAEPKSVQICPRKALTGRKLMIAIEHKAHGVLATVAGEFTLADYREFEENVLYEVQFHGKPNLLFDLTEMLSYTLDVVWEEIRFSRQHGHQFGRVAVVTQDQWMTWATWLARLFVDSEVRVFDDAAQAEAWLGEATMVMN